MTPDQINPDNTEMYKQLYEKMSKVLLLIT